MCGLESDRVMRHGREGEKGGWQEEDEARFCCRRYTLFGTRNKTLDYYKKQNTTRVMGKCKINWDLLQKRRLVSIQPLDHIAQLLNRVQRRIVCLVPFRFVVHNQTPRALIQDTDDDFVQNHL